MIKAFNTDQQRLIEIKPTQDVTGRIIWASVFFNEMFVKTVNSVVPSLTKRYLSATALNPTDTALSLSISLYGRVVNSPDWELISTFVASYLPGANEAETVQFEYDRQGYDHFEVMVDTIDEGLLLQGLRLMSDDVEIKEGLVIGKGIGEEIVVPCNFKDLTPSDKYSIVFEAQGVGVIGKDRLLLFNEDGYTFTAEEEDIRVWPRPGEGEDEELLPPQVVNITTTSQTASIQHSVVTGATGYEFEFDGAIFDTEEENPFTIGGLDPSSPHQVRLRSYNEFETSEWGPITAFQTNAPSQQPPTSVPVIGDITTTTTTATVFFSPVSNAEGYYYRINGGDQVQIGNVTQFMVSGLDTYSTFLVEMKAFNDLGETAWSDGKLFTTQAVVPGTAPEITSLETTNTEIEFSFTSLDKVDGYEYSLNGGEPVEISESPHTITGVSPGATGQLRVRGFNPAGPGPWSDGVSYEMKQAPQTAPEITEFDLLAFEAVAERSDIDNVDGYQYRIVIGTNFNIGMVNPFAIPDLQPETTYNLEVRGYNEWGNGPWSDPVEFTTRAIIDPIVTFTEPLEDVPQGTFTVAGTIEADFDIVALDYRIDEGTWVSLDAGDEFSFEVTENDPGETIIEVRAEDSSERITTEPLAVTVIDVTPPVVGNNGITEIVTLTDSEAVIGFTKATDNVSPQTALVYKLFTGSPELLVLETIETQTLQDEGTDVSQLSISGFAGESFDFRVSVEDEFGNKALYDIGSVLLLSPEINSITVLDGEAEVTQIEGDTDDSDTLGWEVDAFETTPEQEEVTVESSDTDVVTISNVDQENKTFTYTLIGSGTATIVLTSDFDPNVTAEVAVSVTEVTEMTEFESSVGFTAIDP